MATPQCPENLRNAFLGEPRHVRMLPGERLYKFVSYPLMRDRILQSPWWIRQSSFDALQSRARRLAQPLADVARSHLAIAAQWNPGMDAMWGIVLAAEVDAWQGRARSQPVRLADGTASFIGGGEQICVPGLEWRQIAADFSAQHTR
jgi:hypothetical protein